MKKSRQFDIDGYTIYKGSKSMTKQEEVNASIKRNQKKKLATEIISMLEIGVTKESDIVDYFGQKDIYVPRSFIGKVAQAAGYRRARYAKHYVKVNN